MADGLEDMFALFSLILGRNLWRVADRRPTSNRGCPGYGLHNDSAIRDTHH